MSTKTLYTCAWGDHWEKYGEQWSKTVHELNTTPDQIFVVSDKPIECDFDVILCNVEGPYPVTKFRQTAIDNTTSDWYCPADIDDIMMPNYLDNLNDNYDIHCFSFIKSTGKANIAKDKGLANYFEKNISQHICAGISPIQTKNLKNIKVSKYGFQDRLLYMTLLANNCTFFFDPTIRFKYSIHNNSLMTRNKEEVSKKDIETENIFQLIKAALENNESIYNIIK